LQWIRRFIGFDAMRHPREPGPRDIEAFLTHLAVEGRVSASTQDPALSALLFLYREVLQIQLPFLEDIVRASRPRRLPVILTSDEAGALLDGIFWLMAAMLYGTGMRLMERVRLRVKDIDFARREILVRIRCATPSLPTCWRAVMTCAPSRNCSDTAMCAPRRSIRTC
jgi:integrase